MPISIKLSSVSFFQISIISEVNPRITFATSSSFENNFVESLKSTNIAPAHALYPFV